MSNINIKKLKIENYTLDNGLNIVTVENNNIPVVSLYLAYKVGSKDERQTLTGMAHLFEHMMFEGTKQLPKGEFDRYCSRAGGSNNAYTAYDLTNYYMSLPANQLELGLFLESDRLKNYLMQAEALANQQKVVIEEINQTVNEQPYGLWREHLARTAYPASNPYSWEVHGSSSHVAKVTPELANDFFNSYYSVDNAVLVLAGDIGKQSVKLAEKYFADIAPVRGGFSRNEYDTTKLNKGVTKKYQEKSPLPAVFKSYHCPGLGDDAIHQLDILAGILGHGRSSRLYNNLVHNTQIASEIGAYVDKREMGSLLTVYALASAPDADINELDQALNSEIEKIYKSGIEQKEYEKSFNQVTTQMAYDLQRNNGLGDATVYNTLFRNAPERLNHLQELFESINPDSLHQAAREFMAPEDHVTIIANPAGE